MRGEPNRQETMLSLWTPKQCMPADHPLRKIKALADRELKRLSRVFDEMYSDTGRPSVPPERVLAHEVGKLFFDNVVKSAQGGGLVNADHFTVDSTLIEAWASLKSFRRKDTSETDRDEDDPGNATVNFHGEKRSNVRRMSRGRMRRVGRIAKGPGKEAKLYYGGHALMENRHGLSLDISVTFADTKSQWSAAEQMLRRQAKKHRQPKTLGGDKGYDTKGFVGMLKKRQIAPRIAANDKRPRGSAVAEPIRKRQRLP